MDDPASADAIDAAVQLILVEGLLQCVDAKVERVRGDLADTRLRLAEVARLCDEVLAQVRPPNPVHADAAQIRASALALLALPSLTFLDYDY
jgi:hypothetical protein